MTFSQFRDDLRIRFWGGDLASYRIYCFDFVNREHQYIPTPENVTIYTVETAFSPSVEVLSIERSVKKTRAASPQAFTSLDASKFDPNWETYIVPEGTILRLTQQNQPDQFLHIPIRAIIGATLAALASVTGKPQTTVSIKGN